MTNALPRRLKRAVGPADQRAPISPPAETQGWRSDLLLTSQKNPAANLANALTALRRADAWIGVLGHDVFAQRTVALAAPPWAAGSNHWRPRAWSDRDDVLTANWLQHHEIAVGVDIVRAAVEAVAMEASFHPVHDYLNGLQWDRRDRLNLFAQIYLGAQPTAYVKAVGRLALIGAVARIRQPGCKLDTVPIIEGPQGARKSTAVRTLGGEWFTDEISEFGSKDAAMQAARFWFIEIGELDAMSKAETSRIKAFISRTTDQFRPPFGRRIVESKRPSVFWGTTNSDAYLKDETGARRFLPIKAGRIDIDKLAEDRDQLFAEAAYRYDLGEPWWFTGAGVELDAKLEQKARYTEDAWHAPISGYLEHRGDVSVNEILAHVFQMDVVHVDQRAQNRVVACLKQMDWERYRKRVPGRSSPEWRYRPLEGEQ